MVKILIFMHLLKIEAKTSGKTFIKTKKKLKTSNNDFLLKQHDFCKIR